MHDERNTKSQVFIRPGRQRIHQRRESREGCCLCGNCAACIHKTSTTRIFFFESEKRRLEKINARPGIKKTDVAFNKKKPGVTGLVFGWLFYAKILCSCFSNTDVPNFIFVSVFSVIPIPIK